MRLVMVIALVVCSAGLVRPASANGLVDRFRIARMKSAVKKMDLPAEYRAEALRVLDSARGKDVITHLLLGGGRSLNIGGTRIDVDAPGKGSRGRIGIWNFQGDSVLGTHSSVIITPEGGGKARVEKLGTP